MDPSGLSRRSFLAAVIAPVVLAALPRPVCKRPTGISLSFVRRYDLVAGCPARMDVLYGFATVRPELACRVRA